MVPPAAEADPKGLVGRETLRDVMGPRQLYRRADDWARGLSRFRYALLAGVIVTTTLLSVGVLLDVTTTVQAVATGVTMAALYYTFDVNAGDD